MPPLSLVQALQSATPRENAGSRTAGRYDFQTNYAILKLIELQQQGADYRLVFDLYDDLAMLNTSDSSPTEIRLFQIKTKGAGAWQAKDLCDKVGQTAPRSYVARLYAHTETFGAAVKETGFVSNARYKVKLASGQMTSEADHAISGPDLHSTEIAKFKVAVSDDFANANADGWLPTLTLLRTTLGVHDQSATVIGRLAMYAQGASDGGDFGVVAFYDFLKAVITDRTTFSIEGLAYDMRLARKSLTKTEFEEAFTKAINRRKGLIADWETVASDCPSFDIGTVQQVRIKSAVINYMQIRNNGRITAVHLSASIRAWIATNSNVVAAATSIVGLAKQIAASPIERHGFANEELTGACLVEAYEAINES